MKERKEKKIKKTCIYTANDVIVGKVVRGSASLKNKRVTKFIQNSSESISINFLIF